VSQSDIDKSIENIKELSANKLCSFIKDLQEDEVSIKPVSEGSNFGFWESMIISRSDDVKIVYKVFFDCSNVKDLLSNNLNYENVSDDLCIDFINELCNLIAGGVQVQVNGVKKYTTISTPINTIKKNRGQNLLDLTNSFSTAWTLHVPGFQVVMHIRVTLNHSQKYNDFCLIDAKQSGLVTYYDHAS